jgi:predicted Fe-Mo cluster-binding NifX family protein
MKIIIPATSDKMDQPFSPRFGRADYFILVDSETREWEAFPNPAANARGGAGPQAVQFVTNKMAKIVISGRYGPNAFSALEATEIKAFCQEAGIEVFGRIPFDTTITEAIVQGLPVTAYQPESVASQSLREVWHQVIAALEVWHE